jgi:hypothetical protein
MIDAIEIALIESGTGSRWCTTQKDRTTNKPKPVNEQNGSSFVVTEIKESTIVPVSKYQQRRSSPPGGRQRSLTYLPVAYSI